MSGEEKGTGTHIYSVLPMGLELGSVLRVNVAQGVKGERGEDSWRGKGGGCNYSLIILYVSKVIISGKT